MDAPRTNDRLAAYSRSASFAVAVSDAQVRELLALAKNAELMAKYPWHEGWPETNFGTAEELAVQWSTAQVRALVRKGFIDVVPTPPPCHRHQVIRLTDAGRALVDLLLLAGFEALPVDVPSVSKHPDDKPVVNLGAPDHRPSVPTDRRDPADRPFLAGVGPAIDCPDCGATSAFEHAERCMFRGQYERSLHAATTNP